MLAVQVKIYGVLYKESSSMHVNGYYEIPKKISNFWMSVDRLHGPSMLAVQVKIYGVLYK